MRWNAVAAPAYIDGPTDGARFSPAREQTLARGNGMIAAGSAKLTGAGMVSFHYPVSWFETPAIVKCRASPAFPRGFAYLPVLKYDSGIFNGELAMVATTIGASVNTYAPQGIDGDILKVLGPSDNWLFRITGFDLLAHYVAYTPCCKNDATHACLSEACTTRLRSIDRILRLSFHLTKSCGRSARLELGFLGRSGQQRNV